MSLKNLNTHTDLLNLFDYAPYTGHNALIAENQYSPYSNRPMNLRL